MTFLYPFILGLLCICRGQGYIRYGYFCCFLVRIFFCVSFWFLTFFRDTGLCCNCESDGWWHFLSFPGGVTEGTFSLSKHLLLLFCAAFFSTICSSGGHYREWLPSIKKHPKAITMHSLFRLSNIIVLKCQVSNGWSHGTASSLFKSLSAYSLRDDAQQDCYLIFIFFFLFNIFCMDRSLHQAIIMLIWLFWISSAKFPVFRNEHKTSPEL